MTGGVRATGDGGGRTTTPGTPTHRARHSTGLRALARLGLLARSGFYAVLAYLAAAVAGGWDLDGRQANANGALAAVAQTTLGRLALVAAAVGFAGFGVMRIAGAWGDRGPERLRRLTTAGQGVFHLGMAAATTMFLLGRRQTGSEQQHEGTTGRLLGQPLGPWLVAAVGLTVLAVCLWQFRVAATTHFSDSLRTEDMSRRTHRVTLLVGAAGIAGRAAAIAPVGIFLLLAALSADSRQARGLDAYLAELSGTGPGQALVWTVAAGFATFAAYTLLEAKYRNVHAGE
jgi:hypothetical protein